MKDPPRGKPSRGLSLGLSLGLSRGLSRLRAKQAVLHGRDQHQRDMSDGGI